MENTEKAWGTTTDCASLDRQGWRGFKEEGFITHTRVGRGRARREEGGQGGASIHISVFQTFLKLNKT
jgi:hypothetical protein